MLIIISVFTVGILAILIFNWDATKKGARDAWEGEYDPPTEETK